MNNIEETVERTVGCVEMGSEGVDSDLSLSTVKTANNEFFEYLILKYHFIVI